jgi:cobalt-zinc-cadmium efflux system membrane fusion protein
MTVVLLIATAGCDRAAPMEQGDTPGVIVENGVLIVPADSPLAARLRLVEVAAEPWSERLELPGRVEADPRRVWRVTSPVAGRVVDVPVAAGEAVRAGALLFTLDGPDAAAALAAVRQADADSRAARAEVRQAEADLERLRDLAAHEAVARRDVLHAETALAQAEAERGRAEAALAQARETLGTLGLDADAKDGRVRVRAPRAGRILDLQVAPGEYLADPGTPVMEVADLSRVWVVSDVAEHRLGAVRQGAEVEVRFVAFPDMPVRGEVTRIAQTLDADTRTIRVFVEIDNADERLRPGLFGTVRLNETPRMRPVIPAEALVRTGDRTIVVVEDGPGRYVVQTVVPGRPRDGRVPILEGLDPGRRVVADGAVLLLDARGPA